MAQRIPRKISDLAGGAADITVDAAGFSGNLTPEDTTLQRVAQKVDALPLTGAPLSGVVILAGLDNGGDPPLPGAALQAEIAALPPGAKWFWISTGSEQTVGAESAGFAALSLGADAVLSLGSMAGMKVAAFSPLSLDAGAALTFAAFIGAQNSGFDPFALDAGAALGLGTLAGVEVPEGSASFGALSLEVGATLAMGALLGVQQGTFAPLAIDAPADLVLGSMIGVRIGTFAPLTLDAPAALALGAMAGTEEAGAVAGSFTNLTLTAPATLSLGNMSGVQYESFAVLALAAPAALTLGVMAGAQNGSFVPLSLTGGATLVLGAMSGVEEATPFVSVDSGTSASIVGSAASNVYSGIVVESGQPSYELTRVDFYILSIVGDITGISYRAEVWSRSGANLGIIKGTSSAVAGAALVTDAFQPFTFPAGVILSAGDAVVMTRVDHSYNAANYINTAVLGVSGSNYMYTARWYDTLSLGQETLTADRRLRLYGTLASSAPTQPVISATGGDTQVTIALISGGTSATSYDLKWGTSADSRTNTISGVTLPYTHTGRTNGTTYYYSLVAVNAQGSTESAEVSAAAAAVVVLSTLETLPDQEQWTLVNSQIVGGEGVGSSSALNLLALSSATATAQRTFTGLSAGKLRFDYRYGTVGFSPVFNITVNGVTTQIVATPTSYQTSQAINCPAGTVTVIFELYEFEEGDDTVVLDNLRWSAT